MRGAHAVAVGDGGEPLDVAAEQSGEQLGLDLAEDRERGCHVGDRAVVLQKLVAGVDGSDRRGVPVDVEGLDERLDGRLLRPCLAGGEEAFLDAGELVDGELADRVGADLLRQAAQRRDGERVVGLLELGAADVGQHEHLRGASAPARAVDAFLARGEHAFVE